jgi:AcrR family transcriptional regulator
MTMAGTRRKKEASALSEKTPASAEPSALAGVAPTRQARSSATLQALLAAGREALESGSLDAMTIGDIARAANTSVGAFYGRFDNKEAFFAAIQQTQISTIWNDMQALLERLDARDASAAEIVEAIATFWVGFFRANRGLYVAAFKHASAQPGAWTPFKRLGWSGSALIVKKLLPRLKDRRIDDLQVRLAMQFVNGLLVNATINDPGPVTLHDPNMVEHVTRFLCSFLGIERTNKALRALRTPREDRR